MRASQLKSLFAALRRDIRGIAAVEFALIFPLLAMLYLGGFEICRATAIYRKLADTTSEMANITAQYTTMSASDVSTVMNASAQIMAPYATQSLAVVLSEITTDANSAATVTWSSSFNGATPLTTGATFTLPTGMAAPSTSFILVQTSYTYTPSISSSFISGFPMTDEIFIIPRQSPSIPYTG